MTRARPTARSAAVAAENLDDVTLSIAEQVLGRYAVRLDPEHNLLGTLLHVPAATVAAVLTLVEDSDFQAELPRLLIGIVRALVGEGRQPDPVTVAARARRLPRDPDPRARSFDHAAITRHIAEVYTLGWPLNAYSYAAQVVEDSYRRSIWSGCTRLAQMAEQHANLAELETYAAAVIGGWRGMHHRHWLLSRSSIPTPIDRPRRSQPRITPDVAAALARLSA